MSELTANEQRFRVVEVEGFTITPGARTAGQARPGITVSVCDSALAWREVARFRSEDNTLKLSPRDRGIENVRRVTRDRAFEKAAELNLSCRSDEAA